MARDARQCSLKFLLRRRRFQSSTGRQGQRVAGAKSDDTQVRAEDSLRVSHQKYDRADLTRIKSWPVDPVNFVQLPDGTLENHLAYYKASLEKCQLLESEIINCQSGKVRQTSGWPRRLQ